jgi:putative transposase
MLLAALEAEVAAYLEAHVADRDATGHALVVRNGKSRTRKVTLGAGTIRDGQMAGKGEGRLPLLKHF